MDKEIIVTGEKQTRIPDGVEFLNECTIESGTISNIEELYLPDTIKMIQIRVLQDCENLRKLIIPANFYRLPIKAAKNKEGDTVWRKLEISTKGTHHIQVSESFLNISYLLRWLLGARTYNSPLQELVFYGNEKEFYLELPTDLLLFFNYKRPAIHIEHEVTHVKLDFQFGFPISYKPLIYINNFKENVIIEAPASLTPDCFVFRSPKPNQNELND